MPSGGGYIRPSCLGTYPAGIWNIQGQGESGGGGSSPPRGDDSPPCSDPSAEEEPAPFWADGSQDGSETAPPSYVQTPVLRLGLTRWQVRGGGWPWRQQAASLVLTRGAVAAP